MSLHSDLQGRPRLLLQAQLRPLQTDRFQPTGFPDLGPAQYTTPGGTEMLLVESAQSVANHLEEVIWDPSAGDGGDLVEPLRGMAYVSVSVEGAGKTNSILESHRLNSPYILEGKDRTMFDKLVQELGSDAIGRVNIPRRARTIFKYDTNAVLHGIFLAKKELSGGRNRLTRALSGFVEAVDVRQAQSGGVKMDDVDPKGDAKKGFGHVPFARTEYTAKEIRACFNLDLALLESYGLDAAQLDFLVALTLYKIRRFLDRGLRLRTACDLQVDGGLEVQEPEGFKVPDEKQLAELVRKGVAACKAHFADPAITCMLFN